MEVYMKEKPTIICVTPDKIEKCNKGERNCDPCFPKCNPDCRPENETCSATCWPYCNPDCSPEKSCSPSSCFPS